MLQRLLLNCKIICAKIIYVFIFMGIVGSPAHAIDEYAVKSTLVLNFIKFIEWPDGGGGKKFKNNICVIGKSEFSAYADVFKAASYNFVSEKNPANIPSHCSILFIGQSEEGRLAEILDILKGQPILTIADSADFVERGVMLGFTFSDSKIRFVVNSASIKKTQIHIDSDLLGIALKVIDR